MAYASIIHCPKHTSLNPAAALFTQRANAVKALRMFGFGTCDCIDRNSEIIEKFYWANLPNG